MSFLSRAITRHVHKAVDEAIPRILDEKLPAIIDRIAKRRFAENPSVELTEAGFCLALSLALREHWPDLDRHTATYWLWDYLGVPFGAAGYSWTPAAAKELADAYVAEFGEQP